MPTARPWIRRALPPVLTLLVLALPSRSTFADEVPTADDPPPADAVQLRPVDSSVPTRLLIGGTVYKRSLTLERMRFRRDGDPWAGKGEVEIPWTIVPNLTSPNFKQNGRLGRYKHIKHSKKPKKCDDDGCDNHGTAECQWFAPNAEMFADWTVENNFCEVLEVNLDFFDEDKKSKNERRIGTFDTNGGDVPHLTMPAIVPEGNATRCDDFALVNTVNQKPARIALRWNIDAKLFGSLAGTLPCERDPGCGEIDNYAYMHVSGPVFRSEIGMKTLDLNAMFSGNRKFYVYYDTDANVGTGAPGFPFCGADYRVYVDMQYSGTGTPIVTKRIEVWTQSLQSWGLTGTSPITFEIKGKLLVIEILRANIGNPAAQVVSWTAFEQNSILAGINPCLPCNERIVVPMGTDQDCARVTAFDDSEIATGNAQGVLRIAFSEPMSPIAAANFAVTPPLPHGTFLQVAQVDADRGLEVTATPRWPVGLRDLTLLSGVTDQSGNLVEDARNPGSCGVAIPVPFCVEQTDLVIANSGGSAIDIVPAGATVYVRGTNLPTATFPLAYLLPQDALDVEGSLLVDFSNDGPNPVVINGFGTLALTAIGVPVAPNDYGVILDMNANGIVDASDRRSSFCGGGVEVEGRCDDVPGGPIAIWNLDQVGGQVAGELSAAKHGTVHGAATWVAGKVRGALSFNGTSTYVTVPMDGDLKIEEEDFTVGGWIKTTGTTAILLSHLDPTGIGYSLFLLGGTPVLNLSDASGASSYIAKASPNSADGQWHHIMATVDRDSPTGVRIYRDGVLVHTDDPTARQGALVHDDPLVFGGVAGGLFLLAGQLDEIQVSDEAYTPQDVWAIYVNGCGDYIPPGPTDDPRDDLPISRKVLHLAARPNPSSGGSTFQFTLAQSSPVQLAVYDPSGRLVRSLRNGPLTAGTHSIRWDGLTGSGVQAGAGVYFVRLRTDVDAKVVRYVRF